MSSHVQRDPGGLAQGFVDLDLGFGMFHHPAWAIGSYSSGPPARGIPQILTFKTLRQTGRIALHIWILKFLTKASYGGDGVRVAAVVQPAQDEGRGAVLLPDGIRGALLRILQLRIHEERYELHLSSPNKV